ncbi:hypothetical protein BD289DRAFT_454916 [Coniella lustricola]|uniref:Mid2 domain-containing protein n=1 Tax=Coniella lustricola TaxID=2025994 RepID=A0A2T3A1S5_9PEZI|nr:hypothetical protein BD289DRAFT_454916 [Coniella lustricola]
MRAWISPAVLALAGPVWARNLAFTHDIRGADLAGPEATQAPQIAHAASDDLGPVVTPPPSQAAVDALLKRASSSGSNTWENANTCGWYSELSSKPYVCDSPLTCATDTDHVVACSTAGINEFYTVCLDYDAYQSSKCTSAGPKTGCCTESTAPACGTFLWTGSPTRVMYKCFATSTILSMLDEPQYVVAAASSSAAAASSSSAAAVASASSAAAASSASASSAASRASALGGSSLTITSTGSDGSSTTFTAVAGATGTATGVTLVSTVKYTTTGSDGSSTTYTAIADTGAASGTGSSGTSGSGDGGGGSSSSTNTGALIGGIVGGIAGLLMLLLLLCYLMRKKGGNKFGLTLCGGKRKTNKEKHVHNKTYNDTNVENNDKRAYNNSSPTHSSGDKGFSLSLGGAGKQETKKEKNVTKNYYYGDKVKNDNRAYDKREVKDNRKYDNRSDAYSRSVTPSQQQQQQPQDFYFNTVNDQPSQGQYGYNGPDATLIGLAGLDGRGSSRRESRGRQNPANRSDFGPQASASPSPTRDAVMAGAAGTSRRDKRRQQRRQARGERTPSPEPYPESPLHDTELDYGREVGAYSRQGHSVEHDEGYSHEPQQAQQPQQVHVHVHVHNRDSDPVRGRESSRGRHYEQYDEPSGDELEEEEWHQAQERHQPTHRYHPNSGRRNVPVSRSPSPPPPVVEPPSDFIGRGL